MQLQSPAVAPDKGQPGLDAVHFRQLGEMLQEDCLGTRRTLRLCHSSLRQLETLRRQLVLGASEK